MDLIILINVYLILVLMYLSKKIKMKNKHIFITILILNIFYSCEKDYLDVVPDNVLTLDNAFTDEVNAQRFLYTLYASVPSPGSVFNPALTGADETWYPTTERFKVGQAIAQGNQGATNTLGERWRGQGTSSMYVGIRNCNIFISRLELGVRGLSQQKTQQWIAEAKFLKAYFHFYLARMYGPIPISDELIPISSATDNVRLTRNTIDEVFTFISALLDEAIADLPIFIPFENDNLGRITKPIAASIKARILVTYASPLFNGNTVYSDFVNVDGENFFPQQFDAAKWEMAAIASKEAIDICQEAGIRLYQTGDLDIEAPQTDFTLLKATLRGRVTDRWNQEIIWGHTDNTGIIQYESMPRLYSYLNNPVASRHCPTLRIAEMYYTENGVPINEDITYDYANRYNVKLAEASDKFKIEVGQSTAKLNFDREPRFYADLAFDRNSWFGNGRTGTDQFWNIRGRRGEFASIFEPSQYSVTGYWAKKLIHIETEVTNGNSLSTTRYSFPVIRLADLYLYYAEALNEANGPTGEAYNYIDLVRERAGLDGVLASWSSFSTNASKPTTKEGLREIIQQERMIEMSFEGLRFWDMRRWKLAVDLMNKPIKGWNVLQEDLLDYYKVKDLFYPSFSERDYLWPVAENEIINNPTLIQNPGW